MLRKVAKCLIHCALVFDHFHTFVLGGSPHGTDFAKVATWLHDQDSASRVETLDAFEGQHETGPASRGQCLLKNQQE